MESKPLSPKIPFCSSKQIKKNGIRNGSQRYTCNTCSRQFDGGLRSVPNALWRLYSGGKQTANQLAQKYGCSPKSIRRHLAKFDVRTSCAIPKTAVNIIIDTAYFGRQWGGWCCMTQLENRLCLLRKSNTKPARFICRQWRNWKKKAFGYKVLSATASAGCCNRFPIFRCRCANFTKSKPSSVICPEN